MPILLLNVSINLNIPKNANKIIKNRVQTKKRERKGRLLSSPSEPVGRRGTFLVTVAGLSLK